jgi:pimeloyl-ACP methyl ester carboxylesterase
VTNYVLIHGNWHDGSAWTRAAATLEDHGHRAFAPTLPGHGRGVSRQTSYAACARSVVEFVVGQELTDIVLVGHSSGAIFSSKVAEEIPRRIRRLVFLSGVVLEDGECLMDAAPPHYRPMFDQIAAESPDNTVMAPFEVWRAAFINDAGSELARWAYRHLFPESYELMLEPVNLKTFSTLDIPMSYLLPTEDIVYPPGEWGWHPRLTSRLGSHRFLEMPGSHEVMFTNPRGLADQIIEASRD